MDKVLFCLWLWSDIASSILRALRLLWCTYRVTHGGNAKALCLDFTCLYKGCLLDVTLPFAALAALQFCSLHHLPEVLSFSADRGNGCPADAPYALSHLFGTVTDIHV